MTGIAVVCLTLLAAMPATKDEKIKLERAGTLKHKAIREASSLARSRRHPGVFWTLNDSGNPPALFAVKADGTLIREYAVDAPNIDWEELTVDERGALWIGDIGNNGGAMKTRVLHRIDEPDPAKPAPATPLPVRQSIHYRFGSTKPFDTEAFYLDGGSIVLITKRFDRKQARLYRLPMASASPESPAIPVEIGKLDDFDDAATGCSLSDDGSMLAVCWMGGLRVYRRDPSGSWNLEHALRFVVLDQIESISWDGADLRLAGEFRGVYRIDQKVWQETGPKAGRR